MILRHAMAVEIIYRIGRQFARKAVADSKKYRGQFKRPFLLDRTWPMTYNAFVRLVIVRRKQSETYIPTEKEAP